MVDMKQFAKDNFDKLLLVGAYIFTTILVVGLLGMDVKDDSRIMNVFLVSFSNIQGALLALLTGKLFHSNTNPPSDGSAA